MDFCGYGLGWVFYDVFNIVYYGCYGEGYELWFGMFFIIELMINLGKLVVKFLSDGWIVVIKDCFFLV